MPIHSNPVGTTEVDANMISPVGFKIFEDRYETASLLCDEVLTPKDEVSAG